MNFEPPLVQRRGGAGGTGRWVEVEARAPRPVEAAAPATLPQTRARAHVCDFVRSRARNRVRASTRVGVEDYLK